MNLKKVDIGIGISLQDEKANFRRDHIPADLVEVKTMAGAVEDIVGSVVIMPHQCITIPHLCDDITVTNK